VQFVVQECRQTTVKLPRVADYSGGGVEHSLQSIRDRLRRGLPHVAPDGDRRTDNIRSVQDQDGGAEFAGPENDEPRENDSWKMQNHKKDRPERLQITSLWRTFRMALQQTLHYDYDGLNSFD